MDIMQDDEGVGLSPLARGTHQAANFECIGGRFIPAGAGNTPLFATAIDE